MLLQILWYLTQFLKENHQNSTWKSLHVNRAREPHVNLDSFIFHSFSKKIIKIPLENPWTWVTTLSTIKSVTNTFISLGEKTKKKRNNNLWEVCFSSAAVVSKLLLGCSGHFLFILCHWNPTVHSLTCMIHVQLQRTAWNVTFLPRRATKVKFFTPWY